MKKIMIISQYFYPEQFRINDISRELVDRGYEVTVITGLPNYPEGKIYKGYRCIKNRCEIWNGIRVIRLPLIPRGKSAAMLVLNYLSFVVSGGIWQFFTKIRADYVFIFEVSPMTQALPGVWFAARRKIPCYLYMQDLWPDNVEIVTGIHNKAIIRPIEQMVNYIYGKCTYVLVTSKSFAKELIKRGVEEDKVSFLPQYAEALYKPAERAASEILPDDSFKVIFTGNIGYAQGLDILVETAKIWKIRENREIRFILVGDGRYKEDMIKRVRTEGLDSQFLFIGKKSPEEIPSLLAACDVAFVSFMDSPLFQMTIPAKLQSYMACGIPILAVAGGETASIIEKAGCGYHSEIGNAEACYTNIKKISLLSRTERSQLGRNGLEYSLCFFDKDKLMDQMEQLFCTRMDRTGE